MNLTNIINVFVQKIKIILPFMLFSVFIFAQAYAASLGGTISEDITLSIDNSPYVIETPLVINSSITMTVPEGIVIKSGGPGIYVNGTLNAQGAVFTSIKDEPDPGDWNGIVFQAGSGGTINDCTLQYGRYFAISGTAYYGQLVILSDNVIIQNSSIMNGSRSGIYIKNASPAVSNNLVSGHKYISDENPGGYGIYMINSASQLTGNTAEDNKNAGIYLYDSPDAVITGNRVSGNGTGGNIFQKGIHVYGRSVKAQFTGNTGTDLIYVDSDTLSESTTWDSSQPWVIARTLTIFKSGILNILKDAVVKFGGTGIIVEGTLNASDSIFTSIKDDIAGGDTNVDGTASIPGPGDWTGIFYKSGSTGTLSGCSIHYGRYFDGYYGQLVIFSDNVIIKNCSIKYGSESGIIVVNSSPEINSNKIMNHVYKSPSNSGGHGISLLNSGSAVINNTISNNNDAGIHIIKSPDASITQNRVYDNGKSGAWYYKGIYMSGDSINARISGNTGTELLYLGNGGILTQERTWDSSHPWVTGWITISTSGKLTISNAVVKSSGYWIKVEGELNASGTVFTCIEDDTARGDTNGDQQKSIPVPGAWKGIAFISGSSGSLNNCELRYGGEFSFDAKNYNAQLVLLSDYVNIANCIIRDGNRSGIYISNSSPEIENNKITGHEYDYPDIIGGHGIYMANSESSLSGNIIWKNGKAGIFIENSPNASITGNQVYGNGTENNVSKYKGIYLSENSLDALISGNAGTDTVYINGGTMLASRNWDSSQIWAGTGTVTIASSSILTITEGTVIKGLEFIVQGELNAYGALFTAMTDDIKRDTNGDGNSSIPAPGDGRGIIFTPGSTGLLDQAAVRYGSQVSANDIQYPGQVVILSDQVEIRNSIIQDGSQAGIYIQDAAPVFANNQIINNQQGIYTKNAYISVHNHIFADNIDFAVFNETSNQPVDASNNFWGHITGPRHETNPGGSGDIVSDYVIFNPWSGQPLDYLYSLRYAITGLQIVSGINSYGYILDLTGDNKTGLEDVILVLHKVSGLK
ncbi:Para-beta-helix domain-containing protein [Desulfonema limicola]|uniref:Para-beta-helix domain-containing protein n=1 Tax=Desulfonema limicola TaxID=45656 RepID=A0A975GJH4_9BACT|nr:right-handed parallel beta-helix repeat-containing protein [Desulfonema limicola]QTA83427.1 Para-beta-helix domain-containing protein [Desulfonema limicola]